MANGAAGVIEYRRVSTDEQASRGVSLDAQREAIDSYCDREGLVIACRLSDPGRTGGDMDRPGLKEALRILDAGAASGIVVSALDRLTRSIGDFEYLLSGYFRAGVRLHVVHGQVDLESAAGRMVARLLIVVGQHELERTAERTEEVMARKRRAGERLGTVPYGKTVADDGKSLVDQPAELATLETMRAWREDGWTIRRIAAQLNEASVPTRSGRAWRASTVQQILARCKPEGGADVTLA